jgi:hypothetical protein
MFNIDGDIVSVEQRVNIWRHLFFRGEGPRSRCYGSTAALRLLVQPCDEDEQFFFTKFYK